MDKLNNMFNISEKPTLSYFTNHKVYPIIENSVGSSKSNLSTGFNGSFYKPSIGNNAPHMLRMGSNRGLLAKPDGLDNSVSFMAKDITMYGESSSPTFISEYNKTRLLYNIDPIIHSRPENHPNLEPIIDRINEEEIISQNDRDKSDKIVWNCFWSLFCLSKKNLS